MSATVSKSAKTLTLVYSGAIAALQTWPAGSWTVTDSIGASTSNNTTSTAGSTTQVINYTSFAALALGSGTVAFPNSTGVQDSLGRVLDAVVGFPVTINA